MRWPTRTIRYGSRSQTVRGEESGLIAGYNMRPAEGVVPDESTYSNDGAPVGSLLFEGSIFRNSYRFYGADGYIDVGNVGQDCKTVSFWIKANSDEYVIDLDGGTHYVWINGGVVTAEGFDSPTIYVDGVPDTELSVTDKWHHVVVVTGTAITMSDLDIGRQGANYFDGLLAAPSFYNDEKTQQWVTRRYLEGARAVQLATGWGFYETASNYTAGDYVEPGDALRVVSGEWAVEVDTIDGAVAKVLACKADGQAWIPACYFLATKAGQAYGTWKTWLKKADASEMQIYTVTDAQAPTAGYALKWAADEVVTIEETGVGTVVGGGSASADTWHELAMTRRYDGLFQGFVDRVSFGTADDATTQESEGILVEADAGDKIALSDLRGNHCLSKQLGVTL